MAVTGAKKGFPPPISKPPGWVNPPNTQPSDPIAGRPRNPKPPKPFPVFPGAPIQPPPGAIVIDDGANLKWPVGNPEERPFSFVSTEDAAKIEPNASANDANNSMVAGSSRNTIHGEENNALRGNKVDEREGENTATKGVETALPVARYGDTDGLVFPHFNCPGSQSYVALSLSGVPGGCGCWVNTGADLSLFLGAGLGPKLLKYAKGLNQIRPERASKYLRRFLANKENLDAMRKAMGKKKANELINSVVKSIERGDDINVMITFGQWGLGLAAYGPFLGALLGASAVYRQKTCVGANAYLNTNTCTCECYPGYEDCDIPNGINFIGRAFGWYWDILELPIIDPDEIMGCVEKCNCQGTFIKDPAAWSGQICECECAVDPVAQSCPDGYTFDDSADVCCCVPFDDNSSFKECCDGTNIISIGTGSCTAEGYLDTCDVLGYGDQIVCDCHA